MARKTPKYFKMAIHYMVVLCWGMVETNQRYAFYG